MEIFNDYSRYYNLLYKDKDYSAEVDYIDGLIKNHRSDAKTILDLGCGTGLHANLLSERKYSVCGVDRSEEMLSFAKKIPIKPNLTFQHGDIRTLKLNRRFDVVVSLFHVMSYQITNSDLANAFQTAYDHLEKGGIFLFDFWYGPAVLRDPPVVRIKRFGDNEINVIRIAEPLMHPNENTVDINYQMIIHSRPTGLTSTLEEKHVMRYFFKREIEGYLSNLNLKLLNFEEWMTQKEPGFNSWNVVCLAKK
jgi:SAM-dependent methyltransferase